MILLLFGGVFFYIFFIFYFASKIAEERERKRSGELWVGGCRYAFVLGEKQSRKEGKKERRLRISPGRDFFFAGGKKSCWKLFAIGKDGTGQDRTEVRRKRGRDGLFG